MTDAVLRGAEASIAKGSQSFAAAARIFPADVRADCVMLYAWCRHADDVIDGQDLGHAQRADFRAGQRARLVTLRAQTEAALHGAPQTDPVFESLRRVVERNAIPPRHPLALIDGFAMDVEEKHYATTDDLLTYCYHVAGVVGVMMAQIMGVRDERTLDRASDLGIGFQLTNIARDVMEDAAAGRCYIPDDILAATPTRYAAALRLLDMAEAYYDSALDGIAELPPRSALAIAAARRVYRAIGEKLRKGGPEAWERRISTTKAEKAALFTAALGDVARSRFRTPSPRVGLYSRPS
ncbi:phytoene/squalene synthase family protein [Falsirhodobacter halotolerans]|uniref:phytoene/squalene synthase family protein n=1 Tax=Falsirhodobacter halotolerans TaxID=1146892 RepID=UPI001FD53B71|nr:phytoene/squalene synthase family protein [Falsirhodobacter halotolerans]MCJ8138927.1 phytoene/squalene synthase family protein [Falsirhodobacter halotolerans]